MPNATKLRWKNPEPNVYVAVGREMTYRIERMRRDNTTRIVWVATVNGSTPEPLASLRAAKASLQSFEDRTNA